MRQLSQICEVQIRGRMTHSHVGTRHLHSSESGKFRYLSHSYTEDERGAALEIVQRSDIAKLYSYFFVPRGTHTLRVWNRVENTGTEPFTLEYVGTYGELMMTEPKTFRETEFWLPSNGSYCECQWSRAPLTAFGVFGGHNMKSFKKFCVSNTGTWSTKTYLPMGALKKKDGGFVLWQIEANGSWAYELSDLFDSLTLHLSGPTFEEHNWQKTLQPGESFETVKAAVTWGNNFNEVTANMTAYRRAVTGQKQGKRACHLQRIHVCFVEFAVRKDRRGAGAPPPSGSGRDITSSTAAGTTSRRIRSIISEDGRNPARGIRTD